MNVTSKTTCLEAALEYARRGYSIIPVTSNKKPLLSEWKVWQEKRADETQIRKWFSQYPSANVAIVTGAISGLVVVDIEKGGDDTTLPFSSIVTTGGGGFHFYYKYDPKHPIGNAVKMRKLTDLRGDGGYVVAPPSLHKSGKRYEWFSSEDLADFPYDLFGSQEENVGIPTKQKSYYDKVSKGERNNVATSLAGKLLAKLPESLWDTAGYDAFSTWNANVCTPPLEAKELLSVWNSIRSRQVKKKGSQKEDSHRENQAETLLKLFEEEGNLLFRDEMDEGYAQVTINSRREVIKCSKKGFEKYLNRMFWKSQGKAIGSEALSKVVNCLTAKAEYDGDKIPLHNRVACYQGDFWYDLGDGKAVLITKDSWELVQDVPIIFRTHQHQESQVLPTKCDGSDSSIRLVFKYVHIKQETQQILYLVWLVAAFVPEIPHAILALFGEKGASKSTTMHLTRSLIDPSKTMLLALPRSNEMVQQLEHHYASFFDNVSKIGGKVSDILCRAVTGTGNSKRKLYSDDDDVIYQFRRVIAMNGINNVVQAPDLLDRSLLIELNRIAKEDRKTEKELFAAFLEDKPLILAGIFDVLVRARSIFDTLNLQEFPRMADFAKWGYAIADALGFGGESFLEAYTANITKQNEEVLSSDSVASTLCILMERHEVWEGSPTELLSELLEIAEEEKLDLKTMPKSPPILGRHIPTINSNLLEAGILVEKEKDRKRRGRTYRISRLTVATDAVEESKHVSQTTSDTSDGSDRITNTKDLENCEGDLNLDRVVEIFGPGAEVIYPLPEKQ